MFILRFSHGVAARYDFETISEFNQNGIHSTPTYQDAAGLTLAVR